MEPTGDDVHRNKRLAEPRNPLYVGYSKEVALAMPAFVGQLDKGPPPRVHSAQVWLPAHAVILPPLRQKLRAEAND